REIVADARCVEYGAGLARIGIDAENEELSRQRAEIDHPVNQHFRRILVGNFDFSPIMVVAWLDNSGYEDEVDRFVDLIFDRLESHPASLANRGRHPGAE